MTTPICKLIKGPRSIDLNDFSRFFLTQDFVPPPVAIAPLWAGGTSANRDGSIKVSETPVNREFSFTVNLTGNSAADIRQWAARVESFLQQAGDENEPLYLAFKPDSDTPQPLWGQGGAFLYYEIRHGTATLDRRYMVGAKLASDVDLTISLVIAPYAVGLQQRLTSALGRLHEDVLGQADGISRGLHIGPSLTNKMTNPVFGHATFGNGWTADASLTASQNTLPQYMIPGTINSAKLLSRAANQEYYQSINAGNTNTHTFICLIFLPDLGTPSSSDMQIFYNATLTTTFVELGNGLWLCSATAAGINAATNTGVQVKSGRGIYLCFMGMCETANIFYPFWGDNLGCAWSGTAHASTSTSTAGRARLAVAAETFEYQQGSVRFVWTPAQAYSAYANGNYYLMDAGSLDFYFNATSDVFTVVDGTNTLTIATTFAAHTPIVFHITWGPAGLTLYVNGAQADTDSYAFPAAASYVYLGTDSSAANHAMGLFGGFDHWNEPLTAAEVLADYTNITPLLSLSDLPRRKRVTCIPWLWTKDGDDVIDNHDDSGEDNWGVVAGIPGSEEAKTEYRITPSNLGADAYWLCCVSIPPEKFKAPNGLFYYDTQGTVDANSSGGEYRSMAGLSTTSQSVSLPEIFTGEVHGFVRGRPSVATASTGINFDYGSDIVLVLSRTYTATSANMNLYYYGSGAMGLSKLALGLSIAPLILFGVATGTFLIDFVAVLPGPVLKVVQNTTITYFVVDGTEVRTNSAKRLPAIGNPINAQPGKANLIFGFTGDDGEAMTITDTLTFDYIKIIPRYALL